MLAFLVLARRAGLQFGDAWYVAAETALNYTNEGTARSWWDVLASTEGAWRDAYEDRRPRSRLRELQPSVPESDAIARDPAVELVGG